MDVDPSRYANLLILQVSQPKRSQILLHLVILSATNQSYFITYATRQGQDFTLVSVLTGFGAHAPPCAMGAKPTTHPHLVQRTRMEHFFMT
jgi:hypothetical protein